MVEDDPREQTPPAGDSESDSDGYLSEDLGPLIDVWKGMKSGWWNKAGYETFWDYVQESEAKWARMGFDSIYKKRRKRPKPQVAGR
jgi:hypothetical protein